MFLRGRLLRQMPGQRMTGRLAEEGGFLGGGFQQLLVLVVDIVAELDGLVAGHPRGQVDPGHRYFLRQCDVLALAGGDGRVDGGAVPFRHLFLQQPGGEVAHIVDPGAAVRIEAVVVAEQIVLVSNQSNQQQLFFFFFFF